MKHRMTEPEVQREIYNPNAPINGETLHMRRLQIVGKEVEAAIAEARPQKCAHLLRHVSNYMPA